MAPKKRFEQSVLFAIQPVIFRHMIKGRLGRFTAIFKKGNNFCDYLFVLSHLTRYSNGSVQEEVKCPNI